jgi:N-acetyl-anhydromuramyl-L-alanine amidase AmpD
VIHHSATPTGGAAAFDRIHKAKHWDELGYHFVIGNGTDTRDGQIEVGPRWRKQKWGAHAKTPDNKYNDYGIGVCLVGNFDITRPTPKQMESVAKLVAFLQQTYNVPAERVLGHQMVKNFDKGGTSTDCPGKNMNIAQIRALSGRRIAETGGTVPLANTASASAGSELLVSDRSGQ